MLRNDTLTTIPTAIARGEAKVPTPEQLLVLRREAHRLRAEEMRRLLRLAVAWLRRGPTLPAGKIDVVTGH
jgi:hypothetical protein